MRRFVFTVFCIAALAATAFAQDDHNDAAPVSVGYAVVTATGGVGPSGITGNLVVFETFGFRSQVPALQAGVMPATMTTRTMLFATAGTRFSRNVGVGITNPGSTDAVVTMTLRRANGSLASTKAISIGARRQAARFLNELFADVPEVLSDFDGSLTLTSNTPVAVVGLRFRDAKFSTIPITSLSQAIALPAVSPGTGGPNGVLLPQFVADGRWASEIIVLNNGTVPLTVRIDLFKQDGTPLVTTLNHTTGSSFLNVVIAPKGVVIFAPRNATGDSDGDLDF